MEVVQTHIIPSASAVDPDVLNAICSLGCFKEREKLIQELLSQKYSKLILNLKFVIFNIFFLFLNYFFSHNTEKVIYFLLLERKRRRPALEDDEEISGRPARPEIQPEQIDPPRKRLDTCRINGQNSFQYGQISEGSPVTPRRQAFK